MIVKVKHFSYRGIQVCFFIIINDFQEKIVFPEFALYSAGFEILKKSLPGFYQAIRETFYFYFRVVISKINFKSSKINPPKLVFSL